MHEDEEIKEIVHSYEEMVHSVGRAHPRRTWATRVVGLLIGGMLGCASTPPKVDTRLELPYNHVLEVTLIGERVRRGGSPSLRLRDYRCPADALMVCEVFGALKECRCVR